MVFCLQVAKPGKLVVQVLFISVWWCPVFSPCLCTCSLSRLYKAGDSRPGNHQCLCLSFSRAVCVGLGFELVRSGQGPGWRCARAVCLTLGFAD